jgi:hypothetical protein
VWRASDPRSEGGSGSEPPVDRLPEPILDDRNTVAEGGALGPLRDLGGRVTPEQRRGASPFGAPPVDTDRHPPPPKYHARDVEELFAEGARRSPLAEVGLQQLPGE